MGYLLISCHKRLNIAQSAHSSLMSRVKDRRDKRETCSVCDVSIRHMGKDTGRRQGQTFFKSCVECRIYGIKTCLNSDIVFYIFYYYYLSVLRQMRAFPFKSCNKKSGQTTKIRQMIMLLNKSKRKCSLNCGHISASNPFVSVTFT